MTRPRLSAFSVLGVGALFALTGCFGPQAPAPTSTSAAPTTSATQSAAPSPTESTSATASPTASTSAPVTASPTATAAPSSAPSSPSPTPTPEPTFTGFPEQVAPLTVYYVAVGDNGVSGPKIGCGDSLVATTT